MKTTALKFLAVGGVLLAAYPVIIALQPQQKQMSQALNVSNSPAPSIKSDLSEPTRPEAGAPLPLLHELNASGSEVVIRPDPAGHFIVKAQINGIALPVVFDTGASIIALKFEDAVKVGSRLSAMDFRTQIQTANGLTPAAEVTLKDVRIDGIVISNVPAMVLPPGKLETSLLGRSFWGRLKSGFSYSAGNLILKN